MAATIREELHEQLLPALRKGQETALDALKTLAETIQFVTPRVPPAGPSWSPHEVAAGGYGFGERLVYQPYVDGITDTVPHGIASSLTAGQIETAIDEDMLGVSVICPDRWFPGDVAVVTSRDGHAFAGEVEGMDVSTGEVTIRLPGS